MESPRSPQDPSAYLESLMQAGQQSLKQFDDAMAAAMGLAEKKDQEASPFVAAANLQRDAVLQFWKFWNTTLVKAIGVEGNIEPGKGDRRFKDDAWAQTPYYDLLKQSYLLSSKQLTDFVEQAQVDDRTRMQLKFYARQFIDAMSPSNFPATNPEVIRTAIQTRSASLAAGMNNLMEDLQKGRITRVDESKFEVGGNLANTPGSV
ncbi:MAG: class I poly(R)-hydroxyalkanoic acid synthase, partial [Bradyrhizobium icense]